MPSPILTLSNLVRRIDADQVLLELSQLTIDAGDRLAIVGPIGSGKSTLLRAIAMLDPIEGDVHWNGALVSAENIIRYRRQVVYLAQRSAVVSGTVRDNLKLPFELQIAAGETSPKYDETRGIQLLDQLGKQPAFLDQSAEQLSGGEGQLVALVRAILVDPSVLLLDEPTASLDPETTLRFEQVVMDWHNPGGRALLLVSHDESQRDRLTSRQILLDAGRMVEGVPHA